MFMKSAVQVLDVERGPSAVDRKYGEVEEHAREDAGEGAEGNDPAEAGEGTEVVQKEIGAAVVPKLR